MGALNWHMCAMAALGSLLCSAAPVSDSFTVQVTSSVSVPRGHTITLPCWLSPPQSAEAYEVRWYRPSSFDSPVFLYRSRNLEDTSQVESYKGRVSFGLKDAASGGLKMGDVSLKLENVTIKDTGVFTCYVSSDQGYDSASVNLIVTQTGDSPLLSSVWTEDKKVNVSCESKGWYPEPSLLWSDSKQPSKNTKFSKDSSGLLSVHSWIVVPVLEQVSCSVGLSGAETKEARAHFGEPPEAEAGSSAGGWVAFALLLIAALAALAVFYFRKRGEKSRSRNDELDGKTAGSGHDEPEVSQKLLPRGETMPPNLSSDHYVNVTLDETKNQFLTVRGNKVRDAQVNTFPDGEEVTCCTAIKGRPGFASGQHYWEVSLGTGEVNPKLSWWVGITSATAISMNTSPTTANGFWFLSSSPEESKRFRFNSEPQVVFPVFSRPQTIGVYLNYESGELSFYDVENMRLIGSLQARFTGEVFPFFNPGKGDQAPIEILQRVKDGHCGDVPDSQPQSNNTSQP